MTEHFANVAARSTYRELLEQSDVVRLHGVHIHGVEVTQAIQYYRADDHLARASDRAPDNAIRMVAGKPAWVRVYVRSGLLAKDVPNVTGELEILRRHAGLYYNPVTTLSPRSPGFVTAHQNPSYTDERSNLNFTLNFVIPAKRSRVVPPGIFDVMCGVLKLRVKITAPGGVSDTMELDVDATLEQTLRLRGIMVTYNGPSSSAAGAPNINLAAPTLANLQATAALALLMFPVQSRGVFSRGGVTTFNQHLQDSVPTAGGCSPNWTMLLQQLQQARVDDGNRSDWIYYGLLPTSTPVGTTPGTNSGCGDDGLGSAPVGFGLSMAHELGHACGIHHAPCGNVGTGSQFVELDYPAYEPYDPNNTPQASIGEYGLDVSTGNIFRPNNTKDLMSYCGPPTWFNWISLYTYGLLLHNQQLAPRGACRDETYWDEVTYDPWWDIPVPAPDPWRDRVVNRERLISIIGTVHNENEVEVTSVMRVEAESAVHNGRATDLSAELVGTTGRALARGTLFALHGYGHGGCGCKGDAETHRPRYPFVFQAFVPDAEPGASLVIRQGEKELWTRRAPETHPEVTEFRALLEGDRLILAWELESASEVESEVWMQWSNDGGETWNGLTTGVRGNEAALDVSTLPSGSVQLRLLASDGFHTAVSEEVTVEIPRRAPEVSILTPRDGQTFLVGGTIRLWGAATRSSGEAVPDENARWFLNGEELEPGFDSFIDAPEAGEHRLTLIVSVDRSTAEANVEFRTIETLGERHEAD